MRSVDEWFSKRDDAPIPPRVRLRVFDRDKGRCQCGCGIKIVPGDKWETDHIRALINGGEHCESNLQTLLSAHHKIKTRADVGLKAKSDRIRKRHLGIKKRGRKISYRLFDGTPVDPNKHTARS